jgi:lipoprotein-anchoring transpeptidase ErfK/SrfK
MAGTWSAAAVASATVLATGCSHNAPAVTARAASPGVIAPVSVPAGSSLLATVKGTIRRYAAPGREQDGTVPGRWYGATSVLPVISRRPGWYQVRLATRPNGSTAWVRAADVTVSTTPYRIVIDLSTRHLKLLRAGKVIMNVPAGIGTKQDPTPAGHYFVAMFEHSPSAGYGPFILVTSAHSEAIRDWQGTGDAVVGIHGPLGEAGRIASGGAALSHGCVRLQVPDLRRLRPVPVGTPIAIVA